jgi:dihydrofolate synthase/folylpolyglutamate synthase
MTYVNAVKYLSSLKRGNANIERAHRILEALGSPEHQLRTIHISGKYGKSSLRRMLSSILTRAKLSVGEFSPFKLLDMREAILVDGKPISHDRFADLIKSVSDEYASLHQDEQPTFEEILCAVAIHHFCEVGCDIAIFEKGPSKNDAANMTESPLVSVIAYMGSESDEGIIFSDLLRRGTQEAVTCPQHKSVYSRIYESCVEITTRLTLPIYSELEINKINLYKTEFSYRGCDYSVRSFSPWQVVNAITAIEAASALNRVGLHIEDSQIKDGLERTVLPYKCEPISFEPTVIVCSIENDESFDSFVASVAQIKEFILGETTLVIDKNSGVSEEKLGNSLCSIGLSPISTCLFDDMVTPAALSKQVSGFIKPILSDESSTASVLIVGRESFIRAVSLEIKKRISQI